MDEQYFYIHPQVLRIDTELAFNVFVKTKNDGYKLLIPTGTVFTSDIQSVFYKNSISTLFIQTEQLPTYYTYMRSYFSQILLDPIISVKSRAKILHELLSDIARDILSEPTVDKVLLYKKVIRIFTEFVIAKPKAIYHFISLTSSNYHDYNHLVNVGIYGFGLTREIFTSREKHNFSEIAAGFFLHDIGKYSIPAEIAQKHDPLTIREWELIKLHPIEGYKILNKMNLLTHEIETIVLQHHERHNGNGYPERLSGDQIHVYSKICSIADTFDALTSHRPYRYSQTSFQALKIMRTEMKQEFDPKYFAKFVLLFSKHQQSLA